jgi:hypothetical protein
MSDGSVVHNPQKHVAVWATYRVDPDVAHCDEREADERCAGEHPPRILHLTCRPAEGRAAEQTACE